MLIFADDCTGDAGSPPDPACWGLRVTDQWQNAAELQAYTTSAANAYYDGGGRLVIKAIQGATAGKAYSSAKLSARHSASGFRFRYGLVEARLRLPTGTGIWPAFWLLGEDNLYGWPFCGEVDVMESPVIDGQPNQVHQGTHSPNPVDGSDVSRGVVPTAAPSDGGWHTYAVDWAPDVLAFYVDHRPTGSITRAAVEGAGGVWQFNHRPLSPILNVAVGGWAGTPGTWSTQSLAVEFVRIWAR